MRLRPLAVTCAVLVPVLLAGCDPRTTALLARTASATGSVSATAAPSATAPTQKEQLLDLINADRRRADLAPLTLHTGVANVARRWAAELARSGSLRHRPDLAAALTAEGVTGWKIAGENVGYGTHVREVHEGFMGSPSHRSNVLNSAFTQVGIGVTESGGRVWVTVDFIGY